MTTKRKLAASAGCIPGTPKEVSRKIIRRKKNMLRERNSFCEWFMPLLRKLGHVERISIVMQETANRKFAVFAYYKVLREERISNGVLHNRKV